jgi:hypothetical protein
MKEALTQYGVINALSKACLSQLLHRDTAVVYRSYFLLKGIDMCLQKTQQNVTMSRKMTNVLELPNSSKRHSSSPCSEHGAMCELSVSFWLQSLLRLCYCSSLSIGTACIFRQNHGDSMVTEWLQSHGDGTVKER